MFLSPKPKFRALKIGKTSRGCFILFITFLKIAKHCLTACLFLLLLFLLYLPSYKKKKVKNKQKRNKGNLTQNHTETDGKRVWFRIKKATTNVKEEKSYKVVNALMLSMVAQHETYGLTLDQNVKDEFLVTNFNSSSDVVACCCFCEQYVLSKKYSVAVFYWRLNDPTLLVCGLYADYMYFSSPTQLSKRFETESVDATLSMIFRDIFFSVRTIHQNLHLLGILYVYKVWRSCHAKINVSTLGGAFSSDK